MMNSGPGSSHVPRTNGKKRFYAFTIEERDVVIQHSQQRHLLREDFAPYGDDKK